MSQFLNILSNRNLSKHNNQSLWKYNLSDSEFHYLRKVLMETKNLSALDAKDCTLYYSEWWKRCFNGGIPSKKDVFNSIANGQWYNEEDLFQNAKKGANLLGIHWIKNQNTLYFRTLLLQGGLPIKHISNNKGSYKNFLLKILEINPNNIDDFAFDTSLTSLLPASCRNDEIYECCLNIVKAIINEDRDYLTLLESSQELKEISSELRIRKQSLNFGNRKTKFRVNWVFEPVKRCIRLYLGIPEMDSEDFRNVFLGNDLNLQLDFEYKLFYNSLVLCKFIKKTNNQFKTVWINQSNLIWDGTDQYPDLYVVGSDGRKHDCKHLISYLPKLNKPTLWTKYSDAQWILEKGCHTAREQGFILFPNDYSHTSSVAVESLNIYGRLLNWITFTNSISFSSQADQQLFKTNSKKIEWFIEDEKPDWMQRANLPVVRRKPKISAFDENSNLINNVIVKWRQRPGTFWSDWNMPIPLGLIEIQLQAGDVVEYDEFFNIGALNRKIYSNSLHQAEIELINNNFIFQINESQVVGIEKNSANKVRLNLKNNTSLPKAILANIKMTGQSRVLRFELLPPFKGIEIIDSNERIVENGASFNLGNLYGYRLMSNMPNMVVNVYNTKRQGIIITEHLSENFIPLRIFEDKINQLYSLSDSMDGDAEIVMEICEDGLQNQTKIREYRIKRYTQKIDWHFDENKQLIIQTNPAKADLFAIPLDCSNEDLSLLDLNNNDGKYSFREIPQFEKFIVFCSKESDAEILPAFISVNPENELTTPEQRIERIIKLKDELLNAAFNDDIWQRFFTYYRICLNNDLSYSTFDILRTIGFSSALASKSFVFLLCNDDTDNFVTDAHKKMEQDLGFSFHWANKTHWEQAMDWIGCFANPELMQVISSGIKFHYNNLYPGNHFSQTSNYVLQDRKPKIEHGYFLNGKINNIRASLGSKVLKELPTTCPKVPEIYKNIIAVTKETANVKILLKSPLAVALSIAGKDESLWNKENEEIRRNVKYSYQLNPEWYSEAINYCLTKI